MRSTPLQRLRGRFFLDRSTLVEGLREALGSLISAPLAAPLAAGALALGALTGCDNPSCVFGSGSCQGGTGTTGQLGVGAASVPEDGLWIDDGVPIVEAVFPSGSEVHPDTPIVVRFSESMDPGSVQGAFRLIDANSIGGLPLATSSVLIGAGRLMVLFPAVGLPANSDIQVVFQDSNEARDLTGQPLQAALESVVGSFTVAETAPETPQLVTSWPPAGEQNAGATTDIVAVFDRRMKPTSFLDTGWQVTVDTLPPVPDPIPTAVNISPLGGLPITDTRAWTYRRSDAATGLPLPYLNGSQVSLLLSPGGEVESLDDEVLPQTTIDFRTATFGAPLAASISSAPSDAIGIANLTAGDDRSLELALFLDGAVAGDRISVFAFGTGLGDEPVQVATQSDIDLTTVTNPFTITLGQTPLVQSASPLQAAFVDGEVDLAFRVSRGAVISPLRMLDVDPDTPDVQPALLDTLRPTFTDLTLPGGGGDLFHSSLIDLVLTGSASEELRAVNVTVSGFPNPEDELSNTDLTGAEFAPVVGSSSGGAFIAAPVEIGIVDPVSDGKGGYDVPDLQYSFRIYDRALNANATEIAGLFHQYGVVAGAPVSQGDTIHVEVIDATTLQPVEGALVLAGGYFDEFTPASDLESSLTDAAGRTTVTTKTDGEATVVTIEAAGYDLVSFHGVRTDWLGMLLQPTDEAPAQVAGAITAVSQSAQSFLPNADLQIADSRRLDGVQPTYGALPCTADPFTGLNPNCAFGPESVRPGHLGAQALFVGSFGLSATAFSASEFLKGFQLQVPVPAASSGAVEVSSAQIEKLLSTTETGIQPFELPTSLGTQTLATQPIASFFDALDYDDLVEDSVFAGAAEVFVEARLPGLDRAMPIGPGASYDTTVTDPEYRIEGVYAGELVPYIAQFGDLLEASHLSVSVEDADGNRATARTRLSQLPNPAGFPDSIVPPIVPAIELPAIGADVTLGEFVVRFDDSLINAYKGVYFADGLQRARITDENGRRHMIYRYDDTDMAGDNLTELDLLVLDTTAPGLAGIGTGLALGNISIDAGYSAWQSAAVTPGGFTAPDDAFDRDRFLWSEVPLQATLIARTAPRVVGLVAPAP